MCLMLDQFLWGHSSRVCDISCYFLFSVKLFVCSVARESVSEIADLIREAIEKN